MKGYFITTEKAKELGLLSNPDVNSNLQKVIIAVTLKDVSEYQIEHAKNPLEPTTEKIEETANWFYKNYYDVFLESNFQV